MTASLYHHCDLVPLLGLVIQGSFEGHDQPHLAALDFIYLPVCSTVENAQQNRESFVETQERSDRHSDYSDIGSIRFKRP